MDIYQNEIKSSKQDLRAIFDVSSFNVSHIASENYQNEPEFMKKHASAFEMITVST